MPSHDRFPHPRRHRRMPVRPMLLGLGAGLAIVLAIPLAAGLSGRPSTAPAGHVVSGQEPTPGGSPSPAASRAPTTSPAPRATPAPRAIPAPRATAAPQDATSARGTTASGNGFATAAPTPLAAPGQAGSHGVPPERAWVEWTGTRAPALDTLSDYRWPLAHPRLTLPFGPTAWGSRLVDGEPFHDGVDLATFCNDKVLAAHSGTVLAVGRHYDEVMGWVGDLQPYYNRLDRQHLWPQLPIVVVIDDGNGYRSMYAHMWKINVKVGDRVRAGRVIGYEGMTGRASGCHLHYGLFSPWETATFRLKPDVAKRMKLPREEIARVDPLLVLPPRAGINAPAKPKASPVVKASAQP